MASIQQLIGRYLEAGNQIHLGNIARRSPQLRVALIVNGKDLSIESQPGQSLRERLRLVIGKRKRVDDIQLVLLQFDSESRTESRTKHLLRKVIFVAPGLRAKNRAPLAPQRVSDLTN